MKKIPNATELFQGVDADDVREARVSFQDHMRIIRFVVLKEIKSLYQNIIIGYNESLGYLLVLDNEIQFTQRDFKTYHELMVWLGMILLTGRGRPKPNVAIYGGGDGLAAAEVLKFGSIPTIVDLDSVVVDISREHFSFFNGGSLDKAKIIIGDALKHRPKKKYDFMIMDLVAPTACSSLYDEAAMAKYKEDLAPGGLILFYAEYMMADSFYSCLGKYFKNSFAYGAYTQFVSSYFTFCLFSDSPIDVGRLRRTKLKGEYFCRQHIHEIDFSRLPKMNFRETFEVDQVGSAIIDKGAAAKVVQEV